MMDDSIKILGIDLAKVPMQEVQILSRIEPKVKCKNKHIQSLLIKLFGYKVINKTVQAKVIKVTSNDIPSGYKSTTICFDEYSNNQ